MCFKNQWTISELPQASVLKRGYKNVISVYFHANKLKLSQERFYTWPSFESESFWNSQNGLLQKHRFKSSVSSAND